MTNGDTAAFAEVTILSELIYRTQHQTPVKTCPESFIIIISKKLKVMKFIMFIIDSSNGVVILRLITTISVMTAGLNAISLSGKHASRRKMQ